VTRLEQAYETVHVSERSGVCTITLARPEALNALNMQMKEDLAAAVALVASDDRVRVVVLTGEGRAFCAGGDINEMDPERPAHVHRARTLKTVEGITVPLSRMAKPVIAAVNGHAHGGGMSLVTCCDIVFAAEEATFSLAFVRVGLVPDMGALYFLPRIVGVNRAKEIALTGMQITAREAADMGLVNHVVAADAVLDAATEMANGLAAGPPIVYALAKQMIDQSSRASLEELVQSEALAQAVAYSTPELAERAAAFRKRRSKSSS
jgi:2-(1,2-epoxy-1,2-dihydrophenyl)acetyl-CoA isomerase